MDWEILYQRFLCAYANFDYDRWKKNHKGHAKNKFRDGYSQPNWMNDMREALGRGDEEAVKYIFMVESEYEPKMFEIRSSIK